MNDGLWGLFDGINVHELSKDAMNFVAENNKIYRGYVNGTRSVLQYK